MTRNAGHIKKQATVKHCRRYILANPDHETLSTAKKVKQVEDKELLLHAPYLGGIATTLLVFFSRTAGTRGISPNLLVGALHGFGS